MKGVRRTMVESESIQLYKEVMGSYPTGVTIMTTIDSDSNPVGLTVNSFASVSLDPLMVLWCIDKRSGSLDSFKNAEKFAVNILSADQKEACWTFASSKEKNRFAKISWELSDNKLPIIEGVFGAFECKKVNEIDAGDHIIFLGEVINIQKNDFDPMLYYRRNVGAVPENWTN